MKRLVVVCLACCAMTVFVAFRLGAGSLTVGVAAGTWFFLQAVVRTGGLAGARLARRPSQDARPADPNGSIGMGLAASGIGSAAMFSRTLTGSDPAYSTGLTVWYAAVFVCGILIALGFAGAAAVRERRQSRSR